MRHGALPVTRPRRRDAQAVMSLALASTLVAQPAMLTTYRRGSRSCRDPRSRPLAAVAPGWLELAI
jgi:hypothetical protein